MREIELPEHLIDKSGECWMWLGGTNSEGYGYYKQQRVHRVMLAKKLGRPLVAMALHSCRTPGCCNPDHLREGTHLDNMQDRAKQGMYDGTSPKGEKHHNAKLTDKQREEIRDSSLPGGQTGRSIRRQPSVYSQD